MPTGLDGLYPVWGTPGDTGGQVLASNGFHLASTFPSEDKATHQFTHLGTKISKGQSPPCNLLYFLVYRVLAVFLFLLTTRPLRRWQVVSRKANLGHNKPKQWMNRAGINFNLKGDRECS